MPMIRWRVIFPTSKCTPLSKNLGYAEHDSLSTRKIGEDNTPVSAVGFGAIGVSDFCGDTDEERLKVGIDHGARG